MKHGSNPRRGRARGNNRRGSPSKNSSFESNGPNVKIRGTAQQVQEKYIALARDASSAGDRILAEGYLQFAEHYYRVASAAAEQQASRNKDRAQNGGDAPKEANATGDDKTSDDSGANEQTAKTGPDEAADAGETNDAPKRGRRRNTPKARATTVPDGAGTEEDTDSVEGTAAEAISA